MTELENNVPRGSIEPLEINMVVSNGKWKRSMRTVTAENNALSQDNKENWTTCGNKREWQQLGEEAESQIVQHQWKKGR